MSSGREKSDRLPKGSYSPVDVEMVEIDEDDNGESAWDCTAPYSCIITPTALE